MDKSNENVSLPGAATEKEDPALFEVLSRNVGSREPSPVKEATAADSSQIFEYESHLIESLSEVDTDRRATSRSGVDIDELQPAEDELAKNSQVESETSPKSVIEVEPAAPKILQSVEVQLEPHSIGVATIILDSESELNEKQETTETDLESPALVNQLIKTNKHFETNYEKAVDENCNTKAEVKRVTEAFEDIIEDKENKTQEVPDIKTEEDTGADIKENTTNLEKVVEPSEEVAKEQSPPIVEATKIEVTEQIKLPEVEKRSEEVVKEAVSEVEGRSEEVVKEAVPIKEQVELTEENVPNEEDTKPSPPQQHLSIDINGLPLPSTPLEEEEKKRFLDSIPHLENNSDSIAVSKQAKKEYYQSLRKYLIHEEENKPPVPLQTYRWEDLRRAKERGGYPWTHLYKNPLGADEEPEIVLLLRKSQEFRFHSESPKSLKKVRIHDQVLVKETEKYIQELEEEDEEPEEVEEDNEEHHFSEPEPSDCECISVVSDSFLTAKKPSKLQKLKGILKRKKSTDKSNISPDTHSVVSAPAPHSRREETVSKKTKFMDKLKGLADRHIKRRNIKKISLKKNEQIVLGEDQKIIKLKGSPKSQRGEIPHFEKQDSEDVIEIVELDESPSRKKKDYMDLEEPNHETNSIPVADEIIELPVENSSIPSIVESKASPKVPPKKAPRLQRIHVYEDIEGQLLDDQITEIIELAHVEALKKSLAVQDESYVQDISAKRDIPLDRMGSSEDSEADANRHTLAPISSIDSVSDDERKAPGTQLSPVSEEGDLLESEHDEKTTIRREASPCPSEKKVTFSHIEDEAEPHREDIELPSEVQEVNSSSRWAKMT